MFRPDSWPIQFLTRVCDLLLLNLALVLSCATVACSGAAITSLYAVTLKMLRGQGDTPVKDFLRTLRESFLPSFPATLLLFADLTLLAVLCTALYAEELLLSPALFVLLAIAAVLFTAVLSWLFPLLARFENTFPRHLANAVKLALARLPVTCLMTLVDLLPLLLCLLFPALTGYFAAFWLLIGFAAGAWVNSFYLNRSFEALQGG